MWWRGYRIRFFIVAAMGAVLLSVSSGAPAQAPPDASPQETAATLVKTAVTLIWENALTRPETSAILRPAVSAIQQELASAGVTDPPAPPTLGASDQADLQAVANYLRAAVLASAPRHPEALIAVTLRAITQTLGDPHGAVYTPKELADLIQSLRGESGGIGLQVDLIAGAIVVADITATGPAQRAGLRVGDVVRDVNGQSVEDLTPDHVTQLLRGDAGTQVIVTVQRDRSSLKFTVIREMVREAPIRAQMLDEKIGYIRILEFVDDVHLDVQRALNRLISQGAQGILLDLRQNGGGLVDEAIQVASFFLTRGLVATEEGRGAPVSLLVQPAEPRFTGPLVVLVNKYTASASEIVAGALQDVGVSLVGDRTYGKGTIQTIFPLQAEWGLRLTTARYRTRGGRPIDGIGLNPDVPIGTPAQLIQSPRDAQLSTARFLILRRIAVGGP